MLNQELKRQVGYNTIGEVGSRLPIMIAQVVIARVLGPGIYGVWTILQLAVNYNNLSSIGFNSALAREEPIAIGRNDQVLAEEIRSTVFVSVTIIAGLLSIAIILSAIFLPIKALNHFRISFVLIGFLLLSQQLFIFLQTIYQNNMAFLKLSYGKILFGLVYCVLIVVTVRFGGVNALLFSWLMSFLLAAIYYLFARRDLVPRFSFNLTLARSLLKTGFPLYLAALVKIGISSIDKLAIGLFLGAKVLGYYNVSAVMVAGVTVLSGLVSRVISPNLLHQMGKGASNDQIYECFISIAGKVNWVVGSVCVILSILLLPFIKFILPNFMPGLYAGILLIFAGYLMGAVQFFYVLLTVLGLHAEMVRISIVTLVVFAAIFWALHKLGVVNIGIYASACLTIWLGYLVWLAACVQSKVSSSVMLIRSTMLNIVAPFWIALVCSLVINYCLGKIAWNPLLLCLDTLIVSAILLIIKKLIFSGNGLKLIQAEGS